MVGLFSASVDTQSFDNGDASFTLLVPQGQWRDSYVFPPLFREEHIDVVYHIVIHTQMDDIDGLMVNSVRCLSFSSLSIYM